MCIYRQENEKTAQSRESVYKSHNGLVSNIHVLLLCVCIGVYTQHTHMERASSLRGLHNSWQTLGDSVLTCFRCVSQLEPRAPALPNSLHLAAHHALPVTCTHTASFFLSVILSIVGGLKETLQMKYVEQCLAQSNCLTDVTYSRCHLVVSIPRFSSGRSHS